MEFGILFIRVLCVFLYIFVNKFNKPIRMKKTLLFFLLLFTTLFYAQVNDIEHCSGDTSFNLASQKALLIGNLNPAETIVTYHLSLTDAQNNLNAVANATNYTSASSSLTIYARIENNGTITTNYFNLKVYEQLNVLYTATSISCNGANNAIIHITASGGKAPYAYSLDGGSFIYTGSSTITLVNLSPGSHRMQIKDAIGCATPYYIVQITEPAILSATLDIQNQNVIIVTASGGVGQYLYSLDGTNYQTSNIFPNVPPGNYAVRVRDSQGCVRSVPTTIFPPLQAAAAIVKEIDCNGNATINLVATGGKAPYTFSINGGPYEARTLITDLVAGTYNIAVKDALNSVSNTYSITIQNYTPLTATINFEKINNCSNLPATNISISPVGGKAPYQYSINNYDYQSSSYYGGAYPGTHIIKVKDANGCVYTTPLVIDSPVSLVATVTVNKATECGVKDSVTITATGGQAPYTYSFTGGVSFIDSNTSSDLLVGNHTVFVKDSNGCRYTTYVTVEHLRSTLKSNAYIDPTSCSNQKGIISVFGSGGKSPYQYSINGKPYVSTNIFNNLDPGNYTINTKDDLGCVASLSAVIMQVTQLVVDAKSTNVSCHGDSNGLIIINATGGSGVYTYSISKNGMPFITNTSNSLFSNLNAGSYTIMTTDTNTGCIVTVMVYILEPASPLSANFTVENQTLTINATGGSGEIRYALSPNLDKFSTQNVFQNLEPGNYTGIVRDANGCSVIYNLVIDVPAPSIDGKNTITIEFKAGQTLGDLIVEGQNIKWYSNANNVAKKTNKSSEATLPLSTLLVDGTVYYASQTINGIESTKRLAVTAKLNTSLATPDFTLPNFTYYPNPVQHTLSINNTSNIDEVEIISVTGKSVLSKKINSDHSEMDLSNVASGVYFLKVKAEGKTKTIKIVKK